MDLACHTSFQPKQTTIDSIAYDDSRSIVAVGLSNGAIRLLDSRTLALISHIPGERSRSVRRIVFFENRMITSGIHGSVTMWDLDTLCELSSVDSSQGAIWDMVLDSENSKLYLATETGSIVTIELSQWSMELVATWRSSTSVRALALCIECNHLFVGDASGTISRYSISRGNCDATFSIPARNGVSALVWSLVALGSNRIASGDSMGTLSIWDASACVLIKTRQDHQGDILAMFGSGGELFTSGVDSRIVRYKVGEEKSGIHFVSATTIVPRDISAITVANRKKKILLVGGADGRLGVLNLVGDKKTISAKLDRFCVSQVRTTSTTSGLTFCYEGPYSVSVYSSETGQYIAELCSSESAIAGWACCGSKVLLSFVGGFSVLLEIVLSSGEYSVEELFRTDNMFGSVVALSERTANGIATALIVTNENNLYLIDATGSAKGSVIGSLASSNISSKITQAKILESGSNSRVSVAVATVDGGVYVCDLADARVSTSKKSRKDINSEQLSSNLPTVTELLGKPNNTSIVTALAEDGKLLFVVTADHTVHCVEINSSTPHKWSFALPKSVVKLSPYLHVTGAHVLDNLLTLTGEMFFITVKLNTLTSAPSIDEVKLHSTVPLGGVLVGSSSTGKRRRDPLSSNDVSKKLRVSLVSFKSVKSTLVDQFERKSFNA